MEIEKRVFELIDDLISLVLYNLSDTEYQFHVGIILIIYYAIYADCLLLILLVD